MAFVTADRVLDTSTSTGTGAIVVSGSSPNGYRTFSTVMTTSDTCYYSIQHQTLNEWETGTATYSSANTLTRTTIASSSNANAAVNFSAGTKDVSITFLASKSVQSDPSGQTVNSSGSYTRTSFTATGGQTSFTVSYTVNYVEVYVNGVLLNSADYTASTGTAIVLAVAATAGDIVEVIAFNIGTLTGSPTISGTPTSGQLAAWTGATTVQGIAAPTTAGNVIFTADGSVWSSTAKIVRGTAVASTSGTSIDFTSIPSWVKRITIMLQGVSTNGASIIELRIGSGSITATGYSGSYVYTVLSTATGGSTSTTGFQVPGVSAGNIRSGVYTLINLSGNLWVASGCGAFSEVAGSWQGGGNLTLGGTLDRVRLTTVNGTDTFDAGSVNILYE